MLNDPARARGRFQKTTENFRRALRLGEDNVEKLQKLAQAVFESELIFCRSQVHHAEAALEGGIGLPEVENIARHLENLRARIAELETLSVAEYCDALRKT